MASQATTPQAALNQLLAAADLETDWAESVAFTGAEPVLPANFLLAAAGAAAIAAAGVAAAALWEERTGRRQRVSVDLRHAAAALRSGSWLRVGGRPPGSAWADISGFYETRDERWIQFHCNYSHHRQGVLQMLGCRGDRESVRRATADWNAQQLEDALAEAGMCAGIVRTGAEWEAHPQGQAVARLPVLEVLRIGGGPRADLPAGSRPLSGVRVLDLSRVLAGPIGARTLAEHGADVLRITAAHLPAQPEVDIDTGHGKLAAQLDVREDGQRETLSRLVEQGDVFLQAYRPGTLGARGFSPGDLARLRPGIVYATLSAYGDEGPWRERRGFDSLVQSVSGIVHEHSLGGRGSQEGSRGSAERAPRHLPAQAIDYVSGYLLAFGSMVALRRRTREGGSYLVRVSLAQTGHWIWDLGRVQGVDAREKADLRPEDLDDLMAECDSPFGRLRFLSPAAQMSETPPRWARAAVPLDHHVAAWQ